MTEAVGIRAGSYNAKVEQTGLLFCSNVLFGVPDLPNNSTAQVVICSTFAFGVRAHCKKVRRFLWK
jgi:hypothetical protein